MVKTLDEYKKLKVEDDFWKYTENKDILDIFSHELPKDGKMLIIGASGRDIKFSGYVEEIHVTSINLEDIKRYFFVSTQVISNLERYKDSQDTKKRIMYGMLNSQINALKAIGRKINTAKVHAVLLDGRRLPYKPRIFDVVLMQQLFPIVSNMAEDVMKEASRVIKHDGKTLSDFYPSQKELKGSTLDKKFLEIAEKYDILPEKFYNPDTLTVNLEKLNTELKNKLKPEEFEKVFNKDIRWNQQSFKCHKEDEIIRLHELAGLNIVRTYQYRGGMVDAICRLYVGQLS